MVRFVFRVAFLLLILCQRGLSFPVNICPRIKRVCNALSVLVFTNIQNISVVHSFIAPCSNFSERILGRESSFKELINNFSEIQDVIYSSVTPSRHVRKLYPRIVGVCS